MSLIDLQQAQKKTVGSKQTLKAIKRGQVKVVYIALDAERQVTQIVLQACQSQGIPVVEIETMYNLGRICGIEVGCAVAAVLDA